MLVSHFVTVLAVYRGFFSIFFESFWVVLRPPCLERSESMKQVFVPLELEEQLKQYNPDPMIRVVMLPQDTNARGFIFGGVILSHLDLAASEEAMARAGRRVVTKVIREVNFSAPVQVGDWVSFYTRTTALGRTSITVEVLVVAHRGTVENASLGSPAQRPSLSPSMKMDLVPRSSEALKTSSDLAPRRLESSASETDKHCAICHESLSLSSDISHAC